MRRLALLLLAIVSLAAVTAGAASAARYDFYANAKPHFKVDNSKNGQDIVITATGLTPGTAYGATCDFVKGSHPAIRNGLPDQVVDATGTVTFTADIDGLVAPRHAPGVLDCWLRVGGTTPDKAPVTLPDGTLADIPGQLVKR